MNTAEKGKIEEEKQTNSNNMSNTNASADTNNNCRPICNMFIFWLKRLLSVVTNVPFFFLTLVYRSVIVLTIS